MSNDEWSSVVPWHWRLANATASFVILHYIFNRALCVPEWLIILTITTEEMKTRFCTCAILVLLCAASRGELKWEQTAVDLHPALGDKQAIAHFKYQNVGTTTVRFKSVKPSCGCTSVQTHIDRVAPGEKGEIIATFHIGDRTGVQVKTVTVKTDEFNSAPATTILSLKATIPELLEVQPAFVYWQSGEALKPKTITVRTTKDFTAKSIKVISSNPVFQTKVEKTREGEFRIEVQPAAENGKRNSAIITIQSDSSSRNYYATVMMIGPSTANPLSAAH